MGFFFFLGFLHFEDVPRDVFFHLGGRRVRVKVKKEEVFGVWRFFQGVRKAGKCRREEHIKFAYKVYVFFFAVEFGG